MAAREVIAAADTDAPARSSWKGTLRLSLIQIPVRVFPATNPAADVHFRQLHRRCHTPIQLKKWCPHCKEEVGPDDLVRGYEVGKGRYSIVDPDAIKKLRPATTGVVEISHVTTVDALDPVYIERAYVLAADGAAAATSLAVMRQALTESVAIGHVALHGREYLVALVSKGDQLRLYTLRTKGEVRNTSAIDGASRHVRTKADEVRLARQVIGSLQRVPDLSSFTDHYQEALRAMLARKRPEDIEEAGGAGKPAPLADLRDALRRSLAAARTSARSPARVLTYSHRSGRKARKAS